MITTPFPLYACTFIPSQDSLNLDFHSGTANFIILDETWFNELQAGLTGDTPLVQNNDKCIPFTEDCKRSIRQFIRCLAEIKQNELICSELTKWIPGVPLNLVSTVYSIYLAVSERKNIDLAMLNMLSLASSSFLNNNHCLFQFALYIKETIEDYVDQSCLLPFLVKDGPFSVSTVFDLLAILSLAIRRFITDETAPQRRILRIPAFLGNLVMRVNGYRAQLDAMARHVDLPPSGEPFLEGPVHFSQPLLDSQTYHLKIKNSAVAARTSIGPGSQQPVCLVTGEQLPRHQISTASATDVCLIIDNNKPDGYTKSVARSQPDSPVLLPMLAASASASVSTVAVSGVIPRSRVFLTAASAAVTTFFIIGIRAIRNHFLSLSDAVSAASSHAEHLTDSESPPAMWYRDRLTGYLRHHCVLSNRVTSDTELAYCALSLVQQDEKHQSALAHIMFYGSGLFGEKKSDYLSPSIERVVTGNLIAELLYGCDVDTYLLDTFASNRCISMRAYHDKVTNLSSLQGDTKLTDFFHQRYLYPLMPVLRLDSSNTSYSDYGQVLTGSPTWFLLYLGSQINGGDSTENTIDNATEILRLGYDVLNMLTTGNILEACADSVETALKFVALFVKPEWSPETLPALPEMWGEVYPALYLQFNGYRKQKKKLRVLLNN